MLYAPRMDTELLREFRVWSGVDSRLPTIAEAKMPTGLRGLNKPVFRGSMSPSTWHLSKDGRVFYVTKTQKNGSAAGILYGHNGKKLAKTQVRPEEMGQWKETPIAQVVAAFDQNIVDAIKDYAGDATESRAFKPSWRNAYESEDVTPDFAKAHAATSPEAMSAIFDKLKPGQTVWMAFAAVMSTGDKSFKPYTVGRRSFSKKYNYTTVSLLRSGQKSAGGMMKIALTRRGDGQVLVALGDMGATLLGLYVP